MTQHKKEENFTWGQKLLLTAGAGALATLTTLIIVGIFSSMQPSKCIDDHNTLFRFMNRVERVITVDSMLLDKYKERDLK